MRFAFFFTLLFLLKFPINLSGQNSDINEITAHIQNAIFTKQYDQLSRYSTVDWYKENYDLDRRKSRSIHNLSILAITMDTIPIPIIKEEGKIYTICVIHSEYQTGQQNGKPIMRLVRAGGLTEWNELGCHWGAYVSWNKSLITAVQQKLKANKWYAGPINGEMNNQTLIGFKFYNALKLNNTSHHAFCFTYPTKVVLKASIYSFLGLYEHSPEGAKILAIKKALLEKGYDPGELNNVLDGKTKAALIKFQIDHGLPIGSLDFEILRELGVVR